MDVPLWCLFDCREAFFQMIETVVCFVIPCIFDENARCTCDTAGIFQIERREVEKRIYRVGKAAAHGFRRLSCL